MTEDAAAARLRAALARQILNDAFTAVDFDGPSDKVIEGLALAWSDVRLRIEEIDQEPDAQRLLGVGKPSTAMAQTRMAEPHCTAPPSVVSGRAT